MTMNNGSVPVAMSTEVEESFLDNNAVNRHQQEQKQRQQNQKEQLSNVSEDATIAPYAAELEEEEAIDGSEATEESDADMKRSSWLRTFWIISLYIPFLIQCIFGASFYIIRTLLLGYLLQYILQFFAVAEHWTVQWLGINDHHGKNNSTPLPVLIGLGMLTVLALIVHPDGYTWVILRKIRDGFVTALQSSSTFWAVAVTDYGAILSTAVALATFASLFFLVYVLHRTLASKTPSDARRQSEKHKRKKSKYKSNSRGKTGSRQRPTHPHSQTKFDDEEHTRSEEKSDSLPPLMEDHPVVPDPTPLNSVALGAQTVDCDNENTQHVEPLRNRATSSSTLDSTASSVDSGRSTPTPVAALESNDPGTAEQLKPPAEASKTKGRFSNTPQSRTHNEGSRRMQNNRRGKKTDVHGASSRGAPTTTPSRRWDALKPSARSSGSGRKINYAPNKQSWHHDAHHLNPKEAKTPTRKDPHLSPSRGASHQQQSLPIHHNDPFPKNRNYGAPNDVFSMAPPHHSSDLYGSGPSSNAPRTPFTSPPRLTDETRSCFGVSAPAQFSSSLNPESPSWEDRQSLTRTSCASTPIRPPPGLESVPLQYGVPYGCGSSDGGSAPGSPCQTLPSVLDIAAPVDSTTSSPFLPVSSHTSFYPPRFENVRTTLPFCPPSPNHPHVKENPFATSSDDDDVDEKIEADLQELGGQMVGSILDF